MRGSTGRAILIAAALTGALAAAPAAQGATLVAAPSGSPAGTCVTPDPPCTLARAVNTVAAPGDEVVVQSGTHNLGGATQLDVPANVDVHGSPGDRPVITTAFSNRAVIADESDARLSDLTIFYAGTANALSISNDVVAERLYVLSAGTSACDGLDATLRDTVCWSTASSGNGFISSAGIPITVTTTLRNVTAIATGADSFGINVITNLNLDHTLDVRNVIAGGTDFDVRAETVTAGSTTTIDLANSNYANADATGPGMESVTAAGAGTNQTAAPGFVNAPAGDFHQSPNSVTVDTGAVDPQIGSQDIDGESRNQGDSPDIGADELTADDSPPPGDNFPPDTGIRKGPKKKTPKRKARFEFGGSEPGVTFECRLDVGTRQGSFEPCTSPHKVRGLKRKTKYVFSVRAVDAAGNADPTPADRRWKVVKKKRGK